MKKMLLTLTTAGVLAIPVGVLVAEDAPLEPADPVPTSTDPDPVQDRARRDGGPTTAGERCGNEARDCDREGKGPMAREVEPCRAEEASGEGPFARRREQNRVEEGTGEGSMTRQRKQNRLEDSADVTGAADQAPEPEESGVEEGTTETPQAPAEGQVVTEPDDGANLQNRYGQGN